MGAVYAWSDGARVKLNAQAAGEELERIKLTKGLTADNIVKEAKKVRSPLHDHFDWDDTSAAHLYRCEQARELVRHIRVVRVEAGEERPRRVYIKSPVAPGYADLDSVRAIPEQRDSVLEAAKRDLLAYYGRYNDLKDQFQTDLFSVIEEELSL